jgi:hypothetical protein
VIGGNFALNRGAVDGNLKIAGGTYWLGPRATIGGNLQLANISSGSANDSVCGATVRGNMQVYNSGTAVQIGSTAPLFCSGNTIGGNLQVVGSSGAALMFDNSVGGSMSVVNNTGPVNVVGNAVRGYLLCLDNSDLVMANSNTASLPTTNCQTPIGMTSQR